MSEMTIAGMLRISKDADGALVAITIRAVEGEPVGAVAATTDPRAAKALLAFVEGQSEEEKKDYEATMKLLHEVRQTLGVEEGSSLLRHARYVRDLAYGHVSQQKDTRPRNETEAGE